MNCATCRFWGGEMKAVDGMPLGTCRSQAPKPVAELWSPSEPDRALTYLRARWRWTTGDDWCGEYDPVQE